MYVGFCTTVQQCSDFVQYTETAETTPCIHNGQQYLLDTLGPIPFHSSPLQQLDRTLSYYSHAKHRDMQTITMKLTFHPWFCGQFMTFGLRGHWPWLFSSWSPWEQRNYEMHHDLIDHIPQYGQVVYYSLLPEAISKSKCKNFFL